MRGGLSIGPSLREPGLLPPSGRRTYCPSRALWGVDKYRSLGFNFRYTDLQAAVGMAQRDRRFPQATRIGGQGLWLPSSFDLTEGQVDQIAFVLQRLRVAC